MTTRGRERAARDVERPEHGGVSQPAPRGDTLPSRIQTHVMTKAAANSVREREARGIIISQEDILWQVKSCQTTGNNSHNTCTQPSSASYHHQGSMRPHLEGGPSPLGLGVKLKVSSQLRPTMLNHTEKVIYKMVLCVGSSVSPILGKPSSTATPQ